MVTDKSCKLSEQRVDLPQGTGSGINWASSEEHLPKQYLKKRIKLTTFRRWAKGSKEVANEGPTVLYIRFCSLSNNSK